MDTINKKRRSAVMARIRSKNTQFEREIMKALKKRGKSFTQHADISGKPDIVSRGKKVAVFLDSCFWHGCRWHCRVPKSRRDYWNSKIKGNKDRAKVVDKILRKDGWQVIRFWEHQFQKSFDANIRKIAKLL